MLQSIYKKISTLWKREEGSLRTEISPQSDWKIILIFFIIVLGIVATLSTIFFLQVRSGEVFKTEKTDEIYFETINQEVLDKVSSFFSEKERRLEELRSEDFETFVEDLGEGEPEEEFLSEDEDEDEDEETVEEIDTEEGS